MVDSRGSEKVARAPTQSDLARIARSLNQHGARYAVIGGFAMIHHGFVRTTMDIDLLVEPSADNLERLHAALSILEDRAILEVRPDDLVQYQVVRVADEVVVDLLSLACGVKLSDVEQEIECGELEGTEVRYLSPRALLRTKQTLRDKDAMDRLFLEKLLAEE